MNQQEMIVTITGNTEHTITLDPGSFIFDSRKVNLEAFFSNEYTSEDLFEDQSLAKAWDSHRSQGMKVKNENDVKVDRKAIQTESFGIPLAPFLENASPREDVQSLIFETAKGEQTKMSFDEGKDLILAFSHKGKPLKETGPVHAYEKDGSNQENPLTHIVKIIVE
ncbi:hypothetical protein [Alteribacter populi]|uniref:hypothetical protein n=1 Tax=Alteribacter populi TaxID=2011011 RepID=UPI000BBA41A9|nr:hypothetical protein [Alteribacter populi]